MTPRTFILAGRSGCGKGTQAKLLIEKLEKSGEVMLLETGKKFRELIEAKGYTNDLMRERMATGLLLPEFLAVWNMSGQLIENLKAAHHLVIDGIPRTPLQAQVLAEALTFYKRENVLVILIEVGRDWAKQRLVERKRPDDTEDSIEKRLNWYEADVVPALEYLRKKTDFTFVELKGEQPIEKVQADLVENLKLKT